MDIENLLLSLAYCWYLTPEQILRLHGGGRSLKTIKNKLTELRAEGLVEPIGWTDKKGRRQGSMWQLTAQGHQEIAATAAYPGVPRKRSRTLFRHDVRLLEMVVCIIEAARKTGLCGIKVYREIRLNPDRKTRKPILDGLIIMEVGGTFAAEHPDLVPWSLGRPLDDETLWRIALEADNKTESPQVIADKATNYQRVMNDPKWWAYWSERFGPKMPCVMWAAPLAERREEIIGLWEKRWPDGQWLVTDDEHLAINEWRMHWAAATEPFARVAFPAKAAPAPAQTRQDGLSGATAAASASTPADGLRAATQARYAARLGADELTAPPGPAVAGDIGQFDSFMARIERELETDDAAREARTPRPLEELIAILPWDERRTLDFNADGRNVLDTGITFVSDPQLNREEQKTWKLYAEAQRRTHIAQRAAELAAEISRKQEEAAAQRITERRSARAAAWRARRSWLAEQITQSARAALYTLAVVAFVLALWFVGDLVAPGVLPAWPLRTSAGEHLVAVAGGARAQCLEATGAVSLYASPAAIQQLDPAGQIEPGDQVVWISLTPLQRQPAGSYVYVSRIEQGRIAWQAWIRGSLATPCGT
ncbi:MAG TPA: replication-relaxation family protein [Herpetosiphonaceae bacterium]